ncbi:MAG: ATP-binding cassette domain-containing protein [Micrococcaceae bacterium]
MPSYDYAVQAEGLVKKFGTKRAVDGVNLQVEPGIVYGVLGPNGAGKTTTINMLATLLKPDAGEAKVFGFDVVKDQQSVRANIGLTGQFASVDENMTATENLVLFGKLLGMPAAAARAKANSLLEEFALMEAAKKPLKDFSGGMRRRLDLAASLISQPPLIFLDEPTTGLDPRTRGQMWDTIRRLVTDGSTVLLTTQYLDEADQLAKRIAVIDRGKVVAEDTPDGLKNSVGTSSIQLKVADDTAQAEQIMHNILGSEPILSPEGNTITASMKEANQVTDVLLAMREAGLHIDEVNVQKPSLDEVFLTLTGEKAHEEEEIDYDN